MKFLRILGYIAISPLAAVVGIIGGLYLTIAWGDDEEDVDYRHRIRYSGFKHELQIPEHPQDEV